MTMDFGKIPGSMASQYWAWAKEAKKKKEGEELMFLKQGSFEKIVIKLLTCVL